jgi:hypothetical protein
MRQLVRSTKRQLCVANAHQDRGARTIVSISRASSAAGSSHLPVCAGETWITALRGAISQ